jgi:hypothetical protein
MSDDCNSRKQGDDPKENGADKPRENHKNPYYDRFVTWIEPYLPPPVAENSETAKRRKHFQEHQKLFLEVAGFLFAIVGFIVVFGQLFILAWQVFILSKQTTALQGQLQAMRGQFGAMTNQAAIMQGQLDEAKQDRTLNERAWVTVSKIDAIPTPLSDAFYYNITLKNSGRTPAIKVAVSFGMGTNLVNFPISQVEGATMVGPDGVFMVNTYTFPAHTNYWMPLLQHIYKPLLVFGRITYSDIFTNSHWSTFCWEIDNTTLTNAEEASFGNSCDIGD